jgi:hypothetical protein
MAVWNLETKGETDAIHSLANESDRGATIIAATFLEDRLEQGIIAKLRNEKKVIKELFIPTGAIGAFGTKISIGFLMRLYGRQVFKELKIISKIRNEFAHIIGKSEALSFKSDKIVSLCNELKIIEHYVRPLSESPSVFSTNVVDAVRQSGSIYGADFAEQLADPRYRYVNTCGLLAERFQKPGHTRDPQLPDEFLILGDESYPLP